MAGENLLRDMNQIADILGTTSLNWWPFFESVGTLISGVSAVDLTSRDEAVAVALEDEFAPYRHAGGLHSYHFAQAGNQHLAGTDDASLSFGDASVDSAFSLGAFILPYDISTVALISKYDAVGTLREWKWGIEAGGALEMELYDESEDGTEIGTATGLVTLGKWQHVGMTYDGDEADPEVIHYIDGVADVTTTTVESGTYTAMENTATVPQIAAAGSPAAPIEEFRGRIFMPFIRGGVLTAADMKTLADTQRRMLGVGRV